MIFKLKITPKQIIQVHNPDPFRPYTSPTYNPKQIDSLSLLLSLPNHRHPPLTLKPQHHLKHLHHSDKQSRKRKSKT